VAPSDDWPPVLSGTYRSTLTITMVCPSTGEEITVQRPGDRLDLSFDCPSCGDHHQIQQGRSQSERPRTVPERSILTGRVKFFTATKGWGAIMSPDLPHDVWVHFSVIDGAGYRAFSEGDDVEFRYEDCWGHQDSWHYRATWARRIPTL
jgi:cold shock protein